VGAQGAGDRELRKPTGTAGQPAQDLQSGGIGITIDLNAATGEFRILRVVPGGPAAFAGLSAGTILWEVDGRSLRGLTTAQVVAAIRGKPGTKVRLKMERDDGMIIEMSLERRDLSSLQK